MNSYKTTKAFAIKRIVSLIIFALLLALYAIATNAPIKAKANKTTYAYLPQDTTLYSLEGSEYTAIVILPKTYFVALLEPAEGTYTKVSYLDITGFIEKSKIEIVDYQPVTKYATLTATASNDGMDTNLRATPNHIGGKVISTVPHDTVLSAYGSVNGSALIAAAGNIWHYVKYSANNVNMYGYVYNAHASISAITDNIIQKQPEANAPPQDVVAAPPQMTKTAQIVFIVSLCVPAAAVMLIIFKRPSKKNELPRQKTN